MRYIIMCGGEYARWKTPRHMAFMEGEMLIERTIRLLKENGIKDIAISSNNPVFEQFGVPVLKHDNSYVWNSYYDYQGDWLDCFYPTDEPTCYIFGDVFFSPEAIRTIVETETEDIQFFASAPPFAPEYPKRWAEPFALKVANTDHLKNAIEKTKLMDKAGLFKRKPIMWELWQVISFGRPNVIDYGSYHVINDYTCDIDDPKELER